MTISSRVLFGCKRIALFSLVLSTLFSFSYGHTDDCLILFDQIRQYAKNQRTAQNSALNMTCRIKVVQTGGRVSTEEMEVRLQGKRYAYTSKAMQLYQDAKVFVAIQKESKVIFITRAQPASVNENQMNRMFQLTDSLQKHMIYKGCSKEFGTIKPNEPYHRITFVASPEMKAAGVEAITYWLVEAQAAVRKIHIRFSEGNELGLIEQEFILDRMDFGYKGQPFSGEAVDKVLKNGVLLPEFKGYTLVDQRQK